jgi:stage II sporulation protein GA (sporulation sigma-E factor processing peptidase)
VIYIDELFAANLILDYFLLLAAAKICAIPAQRRRLWLAAAVGAVYAALSALPPAAWLNNPAVKIVSGGVLLLLAFGFRKRFARLALVFFAVSAAAAGAIMAAVYLGGATLARVDLRVLIAAFGASYLAVTLVFRRAARDAGAFRAVEISVEARKTTLRAMEDTGNSLSDPLSGSAVCVVWLDDILPLFAPRLRDELGDAVKRANYDALIALNSQPTGVKFRLLPYSAVGVARGALLGFRPEAITVDGRPRSDLIVAVSPNCVTDNGTYNALI